MISSRSAASFHSQSSNHTTPLTTDRDRLPLQAPPLHWSHHSSAIPSAAVPFTESTHWSHHSSLRTKTNIHARLPANNTIQPLIVPRSQMSAEKWSALQVQTKILEQLEMRTADVNRRATSILAMFRACNPDEFGLIHLHTFQPFFTQTFGVSHHEAEQMFSIGDVQRNNELDYASFRSIFVSIDTDYRVLQSIPHKGGLRSIEAPGSTGDTKDGMQQSEHAIVQGMPKEQRKRYLQHKRVQTLIEHKLKFVEACFVVNEPGMVGMTQSLVRVKLTFLELCQALERLGMNMEGLNEQELQTMFGQTNTKQQQQQQQQQQREQEEEETAVQQNSVGSLIQQQQQIQNYLPPQQQQQQPPQRIGFSELIKANDLYFSLLGSSIEDIQHKRQYTKLHDLYGRRLGRRRVGSGPGASGHLSQPGFLAHDDGRLGISSPDSIDAIHSSSPLRSSQSTSSIARVQHSWQDPSVVAGVATKSNAQALFVPSPDTGCMPRYDEAFNDPAKHLWEQRWIDKSCPDRKRKLAMKGLLGNNDLAQQQNHDMFSRLTFDSSGGDQQQQQQQQQQHLRYAPVVDVGSRPWATGMNWSESR